MSQREPETEEREPAAANDMQRHILNGLASELRWSQTMFRSWLRRHFGISSLVEINSRMEATRIIGWLTGERDRVRDQARHRVLFLASMQKRSESVA